MFSDFAHDCFVISIVFNSFNRFEEMKTKRKKLMKLKIKEKLAFIKMQKEKFAGKNIMLNIFKQKTASY